PRPPIRTFGGRVRGDDLLLPRGARGLKGSGTLDPRLRGESSCRPAKRGARRSLHRGERGRAQERGRDLLDDRPVLLALREYARAVRILGERIELLHALVQAFPGEHVDELVVVAADAVQPVAHLAEALLLERRASEAAEALGDVDDLARH